MSADQYDGLWLLGFCAALVISFGLGAIKGGQP
ncbi:tail virion protein G7P-2 [Marinomonas gallaica]